MYNQINDNIMKLAITYAELQDHVASHFHKTVNFGYVDGATVYVCEPIPGSSAAAWLKRGISEVL